LRRTTDAGLLIDRVLNLEFCIEKLHLTWDDITAEEAAALRIMIEERYIAKQDEAEEKKLEQHQRAMLNR